MRAFTKFNLITAVARAIGLIFIVAGIIKILGIGIGSVAKDTMLYDLSGGSIAVIALVAIVELTLGTWLLLGKCQLPAAIVSLMLCSAFTGLILREMQKSNPKSCGCFALSWYQDGSSAKAPSLTLPLTRVVLMSFGSLFVILANSIPAPRGDAIRPSGLATA